MEITSCKPPRKGILQYLGIPHHEYWPWWLLLIPVWPIWLSYGIILRRITWFTAVNPGMEDSGFVQESKGMILKMIPNEYLPKTEYVDFKEEKIQTNIDFPLVAKPDIGGRGRKIEIIKDQDRLEDYHSRVGENYMLQEWIDYDYEFGIFYYRLPNSTKGQIVSIAQKDFLTIYGDGTSSIAQLLRKSNRGKKQIERLSKYQDLDIIIEKDQKLVLEPIGNHCRGTIFIDRSDLISEKLNEVFDTLCNKIPGFYYGRFDLKTSSIEDLLNGHHIKILELNGLTSDAAHIFDPNSRLRDVFKTQLKHCKICFQIAKANLENHASTTSPFTLLKRSLEFLSSD